MGYNFLYRITLGVKMLDTIAAYIDRHQLLPASGTLVVAVSGGADSLCLLHILHCLCGGAEKRYPSVNLHVAHLNHLLRPTVSSVEASYVSHIAERWGLPITVGEVDVRTLAREEHRSLEEAARTARYRFLRDVAQGGLIAVAHHADDQVETLLLHWLRGEGLAGMGGMSPQQQDIIRPLLEVTHAETVAYCRQHGLVPLEDASNDDPSFLRNRIRHELLPLLTSLNPGIRATLLRNAEVARVDVEWIEAQVDRAELEVVLDEQESSVTLNIVALRRLPLSLQRHLLRRVTARLCGGQSPLELRHYSLLEQLCVQAVSLTSMAQVKTLDLPGGLRAIADLKTLRFERLTGKARQADIFSIQGDALLLPVPGRIAIPGTHWIASAHYVEGDWLREVRQALMREDWDEVWRLLPVTRYSVYIDGKQIGSSLWVRTRHPGDRIQPLGMTHEKKVQDVLVNAHIARADRAALPLFFSASQSYCIWLAGVQLDERVRLTSQTERILHLSIFTA